MARICRKIFIGSLRADVSDADLKNHFSMYGGVASAVVKYHPNGLSRLFGFVIFETPEACQAALATPYQIIKGKQAQVKTPLPRESKVYVGSIPSDCTEAKLLSHFGQYGHIKNIEWPMDRSTRIRRSYAFIVFEGQEAGKLAVAEPKQTIDGHEVCCYI
ncbi:unnamed protein product [Gongylonema pulchrum]|uniref:RRM domain-containing protein n=1 Tax=Gongylonema pulchrum TaxID=637853 RepID=A0A183ELJ0_9BILA|nr:unnamed protein product [Gongylonema pulchrum]